MGDVLPFKTKADKVQEACDRYTSVRYSDGIDCLPDIVRTPEFETAFRVLVVAPPEVSRRDVDPHCPKNVSTEEWIDL